MKHVRNKYENLLMQEIASESFDQGRLQHLIEEYMQIRLNDCMLAKDFASAAKSADSELYLKVLRERVVDELGLTKDAQAAKDLDWTNVGDGKRLLKTAIEESSLNNLDHLDGVGVHNLVARAAGEDTATPFDSLLEEYFTESRREHKKANKLLSQLEDFFSGKADQNNIIAKKAEGLGQ